MAEITFKGNPVHTAGNLPTAGSPAPDFRLTKTDLTDVSISDLKGKKVVLNIFPSVDTGVCAASARRFNQLASSLENTIVLNVSKDLPFAHKRFCAAEGLENVHGASEYKDNSFSQAYGVDMKDGALAGLMSRAVVVVDENGMVTYNQQVADIGIEPDYDAAIAALK
jgi:thioredoxin-dependent peroxiredoxin